MYPIFRITTTRGLQGIPQITSYEVDLKGILIPLLPAIAAFGNFILSVGVHAGWWK
jgi:hypothetical protein